MICKYCKQEIGDRDSEECMSNPHRTNGDPRTDTRPEYKTLGIMIDRYNLENWIVLLKKDWKYLKQYNGIGNIEDIISRLLTLQILKKK